MYWIRLVKQLGCYANSKKVLPRPPLITIYQSFIRPHLYYGDIIYDQENNVSFHQKLESIQYNIALAVTGAIRGTPRRKLYTNLLKAEDGIKNFAAFIMFSRLS